MANLVEGIQAECNRLRECRQLCVDIGPAGMIGAALIMADIQRGEESIASGNVVEMVRTHAYLKSQDGGC